MVITEGTVKMLKTVSQEITPLSKAVAYFLGLQKGTGARWVSESASLASKLPEGLRGDLDEFLQGSGFAPMSSIGREELRRAAAVLVSERGAELDSAAAELKILLQGDVLQAIALLKKQAEGLAVYEEPTSIVPSPTCLESNTRALEVEAEHQLLGRMLEGLGLKLGICDTSLRDLPQSDLGKMWPIPVACAYFKAMLSHPGHPLQFQTGGGALPQFGFMQDKAVHFAAYHRALMNTHREVFVEEFRRIMRCEPDETLLARFTPGPDRKILSRSEVAQKLTSICHGQGRDGCSVGVPRLLDLYQVRQVILTRGRFGVTTDELPEWQLVELLKMLKSAGVDVAQVFDWRNDPEAILFGCRAAVEAGLQVAPMNHPDPDSPISLSYFKKSLKRFLAELPKESIYAVMLKDAPGLIGPELAHKHGQMMAEVVPADIPIWFHSHDTGARSAISYSFFALGVGGDREVVVDACLGESRCAQADIRSLMHLWGEQLVRQVPSAVLDKWTWRLMDQDERMRADLGLPARVNFLQGLKIYEGQSAGGADASTKGDIAKNFLPTMKGVCGSLGDHVLIPMLADAVLGIGPKVKKAFGCPARVTPAMNWTALQALLLCTEGLNKSLLVFDRETQSLVWKGEPDFSEGVIAPNLMEFLWQLNSSKELRQLFPADEVLLARAKEDLRKQLNSGRQGIMDYMKFLSLVKRISKEFFSQPICKKALTAAGGLVKAGKYQEFLDSENREEQRRMLLDVTGSTFFMTMEEAREHCDAAVWSYVGEGSSHKSIKLPFYPELSQEEFITLLVFHTRDLGLNWLRQKLEAEQAQRRVEELQA